MGVTRLILRAGLGLGLLLAAFSVSAAEYPAPKEADWIARDFRFHTGEVMPELRLHYVTIGDPSGEPVLVLHGTAGSAAGMLTPNFEGELFGAGQPLDAANARRPTSCSTTASRHPSPRTPTTTCISGNRRATTTPRRAWSGSRRPSSPSTRPMTSVTLPRPGSWSAS
jgi:hypothetical protein